MEKTNLSSLNLEEINELIKPLGASSFRARQIFNWVYLKSAKSIEDMTDLSKKFRDELSEIATISTSTIKRKQTSKDGTIKYLIEYADGECVETVLMRFDNRANLEIYIKSNYSSYQSIKSTSKDEHDDVSDNQAELVCSDNMTTNISYKIGSKYGSIYDLDSDSTARNSTNYTMKGTCTDEAGNTSSASKNFYRYEEEKYCEQTHTESTCDSSHLNVTNCEDGNNYTTSNGNNTNDIITSINFDTLYFGLVIAIKNAGTKNHPAIAICSLNIIWL